MRPTAVFVVCLMLSVAPALAGSADAPEYTDAAGDVEVTGGGILSSLDPPAFDDVDLLSAWMDESDGLLRIHIVSSAPPEDSTQTTLQTNLERTDRSTLGAQAIELASLDWQITGTTIDAGPANASASLDGETLTLSVPAADLFLAPGDHFVILELARSRTVPGILPLLDEDTMGMDRFDSLPPPGYPTERPQRVDDLRLTLLGGDIDDAAGSRTFSTLPVATQDPDARLAFSLSLANHGTDRETPTLTAEASRGGILSLAQPTAGLLPGESYELDATVTLVDAVTDVRVWINATTARTSVQFTSQVLFEGPPGSTPTLPELPPLDPTPQPTDLERTPKPAGLTWMTTAADATGFISLFGDYGELVLLSLILLVIILFLVLLLIVARPRRSAEPVPEEPVSDDILIEAVSATEARHQIIPGKPTLLLDGLEHSEDDPISGEKVTTTVTIENTGRLGARIRTRLLVDGEVLGEETAACLAGQRVRFKIPWTAGSGPNEAVIQVVPA